MREWSMQERPQSVSANARREPVTRSARGKRQSGKTDYETYD